MDKHVLSLVVALLLLVAAPGHTQSLRDTTSSSSSDTGSSTVLPSRTTINAGDPAREIGSESSSSSHEASRIEAVHVASLPREIKLPPPPASESVFGSAAVAGFSTSSLPELLSPSSDDASPRATSSELVDALPDTLLDAVTLFQDGSTVGSASSDEAGIAKDTTSSASSHSDYGRTSITTGTPVVYVFSSSSVTVSDVVTSNADDTSESTATPLSTDVLDDDSSYSAGTVAPNEDQAVIESTALELSTSPDQVVDDDEVASSTPSAHSTATSSGKKAISAPDKAPSSDQDDTNGDDSTDLATSNSARSSPIFYACVVLGVAGVVGAVFTFRAKRKRDVSEASVTPPISPRAVAVQYMFLSVFTSPTPSTVLRKWWWNDDRQKTRSDGHCHFFPMSSERLPLGAVRTADGEVVVPASRRADGSSRKPIRIRQGYMPQDEVPKYKTVAQRRREQGAKASADTAADELSMDKLSLEQKEEPSAARERPRTSDSQERGRRQPAKDTRATTDASGETGGDNQQQLKRQLTKINKQLKEITKLESAEDDSLTAQQKQKVARKSTLQQQRNDIIAELNGATITRSSGSSTGPRPKVAISL
ncbi:hypothetical protein PHYPSEUDO_013522 [Phytophthora pseudosyringae]|uniref:WIBG Mago-binding domain-containing protein n=1 Tax=Phytophthora pseudosyringae TaxID=221518 RepID=A0A8T1WKT8_9STRA|nr:hypothetical protein PHYPSEUDO_013522 [Phytophthora pseudosyringae]